MEPETIVLALATQDAFFEKTFSNIVEVKARMAHVVSVAKEGQNQIERESNEVIYIPQCADEVSPLLTVIPLRLFAYYVAREKGEDIDKPRNPGKECNRGIAEMGDGAGKSCRLNLHRLRHSGGWRKRMAQRKNCGFP